MQVLIGEFSGWKHLCRPYLMQYRWGRMLVTKKPIKYYHGEPIGIDNGMYTCWKKNRVWTGDRFFRLLNLCKEWNSDPYLCVAPDLPTKGMESLEYSISWMSRLPKYFKWYLALQDGMTMVSVMNASHLFHGLFLGGSNEFKYTGKKWASMAHGLGMRFHWGRCGTQRWLDMARSANSDSIDSALPVRLLACGHERKFHEFVTYVTEWQEQCDK